MDDRELVARILRERVEHLPDDVAEKICFEVSDEILAALAKAGRLAPEVKGDVLLKAYDEAVEVYAGISGEIESDALHAAVVAASGVVAADAERRVRAAVLEEAEQAVRCCGALDENGYFCEKAKAIAAIRALLTPSPAAQPEGDDKCSTP